MRARTTRPESDGQVLTASHRWRGRWTAWRLWSIGVAVAVHAVLIAVTPPWQIALRRPQEVIQILHLNPLVGSGGETDEPAGRGEEPEAPTAELIELGIEVGDREMIEEQALLAALEGGYMPSPGLASLADPIREERPKPVESPAALILEEVAPLSPRLAPVLPSIVWPLIRNPTVVQRFLRRSYNPLHSTDGAHGFVSISMWIDERGKVESAEVRQSSGHPVLDQLALQVFSDVVVFAPARSMGAAIPVSVVISIPFNSTW